MKDRLFAAALILIAISLSSLLTMILAAMGEPSAVWLACDVIGLDGICKGGRHGH